MMPTEHLHIIDDDWQVLPNGYCHIQDDVKNMHNRGTFLLTLWVLLHSVVFCEAGCCYDTINIVDDSLDLHGNVL